jgi:hypothetical protein
VLSSLGAGSSNATAPVAGATLMDSMLAVPVTRFLGAPGLWVGLAVSSMFVVGAVKLRRSAQPI